MSLGDRSYKGIRRLLITDMLIRQHPSKQNTGHQVGKYLHDGSRDCRSVAADRELVSTIGIS
jgi:hypothetical protein